MANINNGPIPGGTFTVLPSAARTAAPDTQEFTTSGHQYLTLVIDATAITATPSITVTVLGVDPVSGKTFTVLAGVAITAVGTQVLRIGPGLTAAANSVANDVLPGRFRISVAHGDADSITYSIGALAA